MTAQIGDRFNFDGKEYTMIAMNEPIGFNPRQYGLTPRHTCTACWRGYFCVYNIMQDGIYLNELYINSDEYPAIEGVMPMVDSEGNEFKYMGHRQYKGLNIKLPYTGKILVGDGFMVGYYIHQGYQRPWAYENLRELIFENGELVKSNDLNEVAAKMREMVNDFEFDPSSFTVDGEAPWWLNEDI